MELTVVISFVYASLSADLILKVVYFMSALLLIVFLQKQQKMSQKRTDEIDTVFQDLYDLMYTRVEELNKVRNELNQMTSLYCDLDKQHVDELNMVHAYYAEEMSKNETVQLEKTFQLEKTVQIDTFEGVLFDDCFSLKKVTLENLYDALDILLNRKDLKLPLDKDHLIKMYLTEIYRRGMWNDMEWWKYDQVTCIACMKKPGGSECNVCLPVGQLPLEESKIIHDMIVDCQWWEMLNRLKPILKERRDELKQIKQHSLKLM